MSEAKTDAVQSMAQATLRRIDDLKPYDRNARTHSKAQVEKIRTSMREFGFTNPMLIDVAAGSLIVAGHGRRLAVLEMAKAGESLRFPSGAEIPAGMVPTIDCSGWSEAKRRTYIIADNQLALDAEWDEELLADEMRSIDEMIGSSQESFALTLTGFDADAIDDLLSDRDRSHRSGEDEAPPVPSKPVTMVGDVWQLGRHRIICGDCLDAANWDRLNIGDGFAVFSSPPYNAGDAAGLRDKYVRGQRKTNKFYDVYGDDAAASEYVALLNGAMNNGFAHCSAVVFNLQPLANAKRPLIAWMDENSSHLVDVITWDKGRAAPHIQSGIMASRFEWIIIMSKLEDASRVVPLSSWQGKYSNVYQAPPQSVNEYAKIHGATFPVHLPEYVIGDLMNRSRGVVDCFVGTGTTIIAAEKLGRDGRGIELSPAYVDVAVNRWQEFTGKQATLDGDGRTFAEIAAERVAAQEAA